VQPVLQYEGPCRLPFLHHTMHEKHHANTGVRGRAEQTKE